MNPAIWKKAVFDAWRQLLASAIILVAFSWIFTWLMSRFSIGRWGLLLSLLPGFVKEMFDVPLDKLATPLGQLSILYVHVITLLICVGWALGRGSDSISGEIGRGTMDLILSLPVWRCTVMAAPAVVTAVGTAALAASVWFGTWLGLRFVTFEQEVQPSRFLPGAVNLFAMVFCFTGVTTMISSWNRDRWRTMGWAGGVFIVSTIIRIVTRMWPEGRWLDWFTFLSLFQPQELILMPERGAGLALEYDGALVGLGLACYAVAAVIFWYRDIPGAR